LPPLLTAQAGLSCPFGTIHLQGGGASAASDGGILLDCSEGIPPMPSASTPFNKGVKDCAHPNRRGGCPHPPAYVAFGFFDAGRETRPLQSTPETATPLSALRTFPLSGESPLTRGTSRGGYQPPLYVDLVFYTVLPLNCARRDGRPVPYGHGAGLYVFNR